MLFHSVLSFVNFQDVDCSIDKYIVFDSVIHRPSCSQSCQSCYYRFWNESCFCLPVFVKPKSWQSYLFTCVLTKKFSFYSGLPNMRLLLNQLTSIIYLCSAHHRRIIVTSSAKFDAVIRYQNFCTNLRVFALVIIISNSSYGFKYNRRF